MAYSHRGDEFLVGARLDVAQDLMPIHRILIQRLRQHLRPGC